MWAQVVKVFHRAGAHGGCGSRQRAGEEKNVGIKVATGQRAAVNHLVGSTSQEAFLLVVESSRGVGLKWR